MRADVVLRKYSELQQCTAIAGEAVDAAGAEGLRDLLGRENRHEAAVRGVHDATQMVDDGHIGADPLMLKALPDAVRSHVADGTAPVIRTEFRIGRRRERLIGGTRQKLSEVLNRRAAVVFSVVDDDLEHREVKVVESVAQLRRDPDLVVR